MFQSRRAVAQVQAVSRGLATLRIEAFGAPAQVVKYNAAPVAPVTPAAGQVAVTIKSCPVIVEDVKRVRGQSLIHNQFGVGGTIGVGVVSALGGGETGLKVNDLVLVLGETWADNVAVEAAKVFKLPSSLSVEQAVTVPVLTAAYGILRKLPNVKAGDVVFQTSGSSAVGQALHQVGEAEGVKIVSVADADLLDATKLAALGKATHGIAGVPHGKLVHQLTKAINPNGAIVIHHGVHKALSAVSPIDLAVSGAIFQNKSLYGFNLHSWAAQDAESFRSALSTVAKLVEEKKANVASSVFAPADFQKALENVEATGALSVLKF